MNSKSNFTTGFPEVLPGIISNNQTMQKIALQVRKISDSSGAVFLNGQTGTGKELFAHAIHQLSGRSGALVSVNCGAIPEGLFESLFFGHEKGSFTGADKKQHGFFQQANGGTLFLDEIAELPLIHQSKLLRVLESRTFSRIGSSEVLAFTGRIVSASHVRLSTEVEHKLFREDLWYRLNLFEIEVPSLNQRRDDIPLLAQYFASQSHRIQFTPCALKLFQFSDWPGNIRQLKNMVDKLTILIEQDDVSAEHIRQLSMLDEPIDWARRVAMDIINMPFTNKLKTVYDALIYQAVESSHGNKSEAARMLGVHRKVIERRIAQIKTVRQ